MSRIDKKQSIRNSGIYATTCLCFGLFWGVSFVNYSDSLFALELSAFVETIVRGVFVIVFALVFARLKKVPRMLYAAACMLLICITLSKIILNQEQFYVVSIGYSIFMAFEMCCIFFLLCVLPRKVLYLLIPAGYALAYVYGMVVSLLPFKSVLNVVLGIATFGVLYVLMNMRGLTSIEASNGKLGFKELSERATGLVRNFGSSNLRTPLFFGAGLLLLVLIGAWIRLCVETASSFWFLDYRVAVGCILAQCAVAFVLIVSGGRIGSKGLSFATLLLFLVMLLACAFFWESGAFYIQRCMDVWLALCETMIFVFCSTMKGTKEEKVAVFGLVQGIVFIGLSLGNILQNAFFKLMSLDNFSFLLLSFIFAFALVVFMFFEVSMYIKNVNHDDSNEECFSAALSSLCDRFSVTPREKEVLEGYSRGRSIGRIAEDMVVSEHTVRTHLKRAYGKLDVHSRQDLIDAIENELKHTAALR